MDLLSAMTTFLRVVDGGSLSKAGRSLGVSPAAISRQLTTLEAELGATLLVRTTRRIAVTEEGRRFYEHAERVVKEVEDARSSVRRERALAGLLTVSVPTAFGVGLLDGSVARLVAKHPGLRVDLRVEDHPVDLVAEGVDVALRAGLLPPDTTSLVAHPLGEGERVVVAAPAYLKKRGEPRTPEDLARHDALVHLHSAANVGTWTLYANDARSVTVAVRGPLRTNAMHALRNAAVAGVGIALLPRFLVVEDLANKRLRVLGLSGFRPRSDAVYALVRAESKDRARVRAFLSHAREELAPRLVSS